MNRRHAHFVALAFATGFVADLILRSLDFPRFRDYFVSRGTLEAAAIAGVLVAGALALAAIAVDPYTHRGKYLVAAAVSAFLVAAVHDAIEPLGPQLRAHSIKGDARFLDTLSGPVSAIVVFGVQDFLLNQ